jgi:hypothetical protein
MLDFLESFSHETAFWNVLVDLFDLKSMGYGVSGGSCYLWCFVK